MRGIRKTMLRVLCTVLCLFLMVACGQNAAAAWQEQYDLGVKYLSEGNYEEAIIAFTAAIDIDEKRPEGFIGRGDAYAGQAEESGSPEEEEAGALYRDALADYLAAIELDDQLVEVYEKAAGVYVSLGDLDAAIELLERGAEATGDEGLSDYLEKLRDSARLKLITYQAAYGPGGQLVEEIWYSYDEAGHLLSRESTHYDRMGQTDRSEVTEYRYDENTGSWWMIPDRQKYETEEWQAAWKEAGQSPGSQGYYAGVASLDYAVCMDPLILEQGWQSRLKDGDVVYNEQEIDEYAWSHAVYTFDEVGLPVAISSYYADGSLSGTAVLEWEVREP